MTAAGWLQAALLIALVTALAVPLGGYIARVFRGERVALSALLGGVERLTYRMLRVDAQEERDWRGYARGLLLFGLVGWAALYLILRTQAIHPLNPEGFGAAPWDLSFNTAGSFVSNTSWQFYGGETTLSLFAQMTGVVVASFTSGAMGIVVAVALIRGLADRRTPLLGNPWVDLVRALLYVLIPICLVAALILGARGVIQTFTGHVTTASGQRFALGPVASQEAIKLLHELRRDGAHAARAGCAAGHVRAHGRPAATGLDALRGDGGPVRRGHRRDLTCRDARLAGPARRRGARAQPRGQGAALRRRRLRAVHGNRHGQWRRRGQRRARVADGPRSARADGEHHDRRGDLRWAGLRPVRHAAARRRSVFIAGLMVGRTPEYLGKKIEVREIKLAVLGTIAIPMLVLAITAFAVVSDLVRASIYASGPGGFAESLYAYASQGFNNGSAFAGYTGFVQPDAPGNAGSHGVTFADVAGGIAMLLGRFLPIVVTLALAGSLSE
jgi:K+-transporting ATPase ATPase A chain